MKPIRIRMLVFALVAAACLSAPVQAQSTAKMLAGFAPGGGVDILARVFAEKWSEAIGRPVVVENKAGAGGLIAMEALKAAPPDGNTLIVATDSSMVVYPHTVAKPAYNSLADFVGIAHTGNYNFGLGISTKVPAETLAEFVAWAKANPKQSSFASSGAGSSLQFYGQMIAQQTGAPLTHVPYRGVGPSVADLAAGQIPAAVLPIGSILPQVRNGKARLLAHSGSKRSAAAPDVPTFKELGYPALEQANWYGIFGPAGMSPDMVAKLHEIFQQAMRTPVIKERMGRLDLEIEEMSPARFAAMIKADFEQRGKVVKASGWDPSKH